MAANTSIKAIPMKIGIVGAGIGGLGAAIALRRAGHDVDLYEKSHFQNEIGAAILITPNGNRILRRWGFDFDKARPVDFKQFRAFDGATLGAKSQTDLSGTEHDFGERICSYHRADLHAGLREVAEKEIEGWARPAKIWLGHEVVGVQPEKGELELKGGEKVVKDLVLMADGCHTPFLPMITQEDIPTVKVGKCVSRLLAPFDKVREHPDAKALWNDQGPGFVTFFSKDAFIVTYPCRGQELLNVAIFHDTRDDEWAKEGWHSSTSHEKVAELLKGCADVVRYIPKTAKDIEVYTVTQRPPSRRIHRGKTLCIGDTTHHMLPTHAQGGCSALEDAGALEVLFALANSVSSVHSGSTSSSTSSKPFVYSPQALEKRLALFEVLRLPRSATTQILSSLNPFLTMEGIASKTAEIRKFYKGVLPPWPLGCEPWSEPIREFFYSYDVFKEAEGALKGFDEETGKMEQGSFSWFSDLGGKGGVGELATTGEVVGIEFKTS